MAILLDDLYSEKEQLKKELKLLRIQAALLFFFCISSLYFFRIAFYNLLYGRDLNAATMDDSLNFDLLYSNSIYLSFCLSLFFFLSSRTISSLKKLATDNSIFQLNKNFRPWMNNVVFRTVLVAVFMGGASYYLSLFSIILLVVLYKNTILLDYINHLIISALLFLISYLIQAYRLKNSYRSETEETP